jgi:putative mRNA 3-end processing factor
VGGAARRLLRRGERDDPREHNRTCTPFEPVACHCFITESTFGCRSIAGRRRTTCSREIDAWWRDNAGNGRASVLYAYALGKAQRVLRAWIRRSADHRARRGRHRAPRVPRSGVRAAATALVTEIATRRCCGVAS